jgi:hypothetical protein
MTTIEKLAARIQTMEDVQAITQLKYRYLRTLDKRDWPALQASFTNDIETQYESGQHCFSGIDEVMSFLVDSFARLTTEGCWAVHLGNHPEVELLSEYAARGHWTLHAPILDVGNGQAAIQVSFYEDEYRKEDGIWRISRTGYSNHMKGSWTAPNFSTEFG